MFSAFACNHEHSLTFSFNHVGKQSLSCLFSSDLLSTTCALNSGWMSTDGTWGDGLTLLRAAHLSRRPLTIVTTSKAEKEEERCHTTHPASIICSSYWHSPSVLACSMAVWTAISMPQRPCLRAIREPWPLKGMPGMPRSPAPQTKKLRKQTSNRTVNALVFKSQGQNHIQS